jgi:hypothetical protein
LHLPRMIVHEKNGFIQHDDGGRSAPKL